MPSQKPKAYALEIATKAVDRLGKKQLWRVVHVLRQLSLPITALAAREALRDIGIFLADDSFIAMTADYGADAFNVDACLEDMLSIFTPRRQHVVDLVCKKLDPEQSGRVTFAVLGDEYDAMRHPAVVTHACDADDVVAAFFDCFSDPDISDSFISIEELRAYYLGLSLVTPKDEDFELLCIRSYSLDRPKLAFEDELARLRGSRAVSRQSRLLGEGRTHPFYTTTSDDYGKEQGMTQYKPSPFVRSQKFSKNLPPRTGGATGMNM